MVLEDFDLVEYKGFIGGVRARVASGSFSWARCRDDLVFFAERGLGVRLFDWQVIFLSRAMSIIHGVDVEGKSFRWLLANTSRQVGKSMMLTIIGLWCVLFNKKPDRRYCTTTVAVISRGGDQAKKLLNEFKLTMESGDRFVRSTYVDGSGKPLFGERFFSNLLSRSHANNTTVISFESHNPVKHGEYFFVGSSAPGRILCLPPTDAVLGYTFTIGFCDEFGSTESFTDEFWKRKLKPTGDANQALWIFTSTPWVPNGVFYDFCNPRNERSVEHICRLQFPIKALELDDCEEAKLQFKNVMADIELLLLEGDLDSVNANYNCKFVKGNLSYFSPDEVYGLFVDDYSSVTSLPRDVLVDVGVDFGGQSTSRSVITVSTMGDSGVIKRLFHIRYDLNKDLELMDDLEMIRKSFNVQRIIPDDCPAGRHLINVMIQKGWDVHPMSFRTDKVKKYGAFRSKLRRGLVRSYTDDVLVGEMLGLEFGAGKQNSVISPSNGLTDDLIDSFVLSSYFFVDDEDEFRFFEV
jgi:hypothetical protein